MAETKETQQPSAPSGSPATPPAKEAPPAKAEDKAPASSSAPSAPSAPTKEEIAAAVAVALGKAPEKAAEKADKPAEKGTETIDPTDVAATLKTLQAELAELKGQVTASKAEVTAVKTNARNDALKAAGIKSEEYTKWAPDVDVTTPEGKAELQKWVDGHRELFSGKAPVTKEPEVKLPYDNGLFRQPGKTMLTQLFEKFGVSN
jgi:hypothetical protein